MITVKQLREVLENLDPKFDTAKVYIECNEPMAQEVVMYESPDGEPALYIADSTEYLDGEMADCDKTQLVG